MKLFSYISIAFLISSFQLSYSQDFVIKSYEKINIDHLGNIYKTNKDNFSLISGSKTKEYQNNFLGNIYSVDISNPLRILIFHKDANQIIFLNNELSIIGDAINLDDIGIPDISATCSSQINGFWIYNNLYNRIEFFDDKLNKIHSSIDLSEYIGTSENIQNLKMNNGKLYLQVSDIGILIFDMFGTYIKTIPLKEINSTEIFSKSILYTKKNKVLSYSFDTLESSIIYEDNKPIRFAKIVGDQLYTLSGGILSTHSLTNN